MSRPISDLPAAAPRASPLFIHVPRGSEARCRHCRGLLVVDTVGWTHFRSGWLCPDEEGIADAEPASIVTERAGEHAGPAKSRGGGTA
jgi:hypothetical protein